GPQPVRLGAVRARLRATDPAGPPGHGGLGGPLGRRPVAPVRSPLADHLPGSFVSRVPPLHSPEPPGPSPPTTHLQFTMQHLATTPRFAAVLLLALPGVVAAPSRQILG